VQRLRPITLEGSVLVATPTTATPSGSPNSASLPFDTVLRGYERRQVDEYVAKAKDEVSELQEREQQIADQLSAAREQADQLHAAAARTADRLRQESEAAAEEAKLRAATDIQRQRDQAQQEIARLDKVQSDVRAELGRLNDVLSNQLAAGPRAVPTQRNGSSPQQPPANGGGANQANQANQAGRRHGKPGREEPVGAH